MYESGASAVRPGLAGSARPGPDQPAGARVRVVGFDAATLLVEPVHRPT